MALLGALAVVARAGSATDVNGLFFTGTNSSGGLVAGGGVDSNWRVVWARVAGTTYSGNTTYTGSAYVVSGSFIDAAWVQNTSSAQWITAPGASTATSGGTLNIGGDFLPGNGTSGTNQAAYVYRLAFNITGTGTGTVTNQVSISMTIAADDRYSVYVNPASIPSVANNGTISAGGTAVSGSGLSAWNNTQSLVLANYSSSNTTNNASFVIGTNYIYVVVQNTNSTTGSQSSTALNPSGLLVYQLGSAATIDGRPVPEVGTVLPVVAALGFFVVSLWRRRRGKGTAAP